MQCILKYLIICISLFSLLTSCTSYEYFASSVNAPIFTDKGQFEGSILTGTNGIDLQLAYAPVNHFGIITTGSYSDRKNRNNYDFHKHKYGEIGLGYFKKIKEKFVFEVYGGYGFGDMEGNYHYDNTLFGINIDDYDKAEYSKYFIQPLFGMSGKVFEGGFTPRFSGINMTMLEQNETQFIVFFEPVFVAKVGYKYIKFISEIGFCLPLGIEYTKDGYPLIFSGQTSFEYSPLIFCLGINMSFGGYND
ncbi:MAG: hypothetical protein K8R68_11475 [Bacteroidales bacterium]|nr:hypothetical protein [Bacteroidales bacterium]